MSIIIEAATRAGEVQRTASAENTIRVQARPGMSYKLATESGGAVPGRQIAKRVGDDLVIEGLPEGRKVVLEGFYKACAEGDNCSMNFPEQDGMPAAILTPGTAPLSTLADGSLLMYPVGGESAANAVAAGTAVAAAAAGSSILTPALAAIGGLAIAAGGGGGSDGGSANSDPVDPPPPDTTAPTPPTIDALGATADSTPDITGQAEPGSTVEIQIDGVVVGTATADANGRWTFTPAEPLADGPHTVTATATDAAGNRSEASVAASVEVDTTAPAEPTVNAAGPTNDTTPVLSGTATVGTGETLTVSVNGITYQVGEALVLDGENWTLTLPEGDALSEGPYTVVATVTDAVGNSSSASAEIVVDLTAPEPPTVGELGLTNNSTPTIAGGAEPGSTVEVFVNGVSVGTTTADADGDWLLTPEEPLGTGNYTVTAVATDAAGNSSGLSAGQTVSIDIDPPDAPSVDSLGNTRNDPPTITGSDAEPGSRVTVRADGNAIGETIADEFGNWSFTPSEVMGDGQYSITATATDAAGNTSEPSTQKGLVIDTDAPDTPTVQALVTNDTTPLIRGTAGPGETVKVVVNGVEYLADADGGGNWSVQIPDANALTEATWPVVATVTDAAGNESLPGSATVTVDLTAPAQPTVNSLNTQDTTPEITGTAVLGEGETLTVNVNNVDYTLGNGLTVDELGNWAVVTAQLGDGTYEVTATVTDAAGNSTADASTNELVIDNPLANAGVWDNIGSYKGIVASGEFTDDKTPELRLTLDSVLEAGETLQIFRQADGGEAQLVATLSGSPTGAGYYSFTDDVRSLLSPGTPGQVATFTYSASVVDAGGGSVSLPLSYEIKYDLAN